MITRVSYTTSEGDDEIQEQGFEDDVQGGVHWGNYSYRMLLVLLVENAAMYIREGIRVSGSVTTQSYHLYTYME